MRLISARAWALVVFSAILQVAAFPIAGPLPQWRAALAWVALTPLLVALITPDTSGRRLTDRNAFILGYLCGFLWYLGNCYWIYQTMNTYGGISEPTALGILFLFSLYLGLYHGLFAYLFAHIRNGSFSVRIALCWTPFVWVAVELARARFTGFPWDLLGYTQIDNLLVTCIAPLAGVMAISFLLIAVNAALVPVCFTKSRLTYAISGAALFLAIACQLGGSIGAKTPAMPLDPQYAVMVQENLSVGAMGRQEDPLALSDELNQFSALSLQPGVEPAGVSASAAQTGSILRLPEGVDPTVVIWPEAPSHLVSIDPFFRASMTDLAHSSDAPLIIGSLGIDRDASARRGFYEYDSASLFDATGIYRGRYDKIHLVPWGEYVPFRKLFIIFDKLTEGVGDMDRGHERTVFSTAEHSYGIFVCYESIFGDEVRHFALNGAEVLVNISDDGWYGDSGAPWQHLNMARMRAIENNRWLLRATNTGVTTAIDPRGRVTPGAPRHVRAGFAFPFDFVRGTTFYTRHGDWFAWMCVFVTLVNAAFSLAVRVRTYLHLRSEHAL